MWMMAMTFAVEEVNNSTVILPNLTLGYEIDDTCRNIPTAMSYAIDLVARYRPNSVCPQRGGESCGPKDKAKQRAFAVIGPAASWISIPVASLTALYDILQISYASTSRILSDKSRYGSFMRTVPSDEHQAEAMADFVRHFDWTYVFLVASDDDYGKMGAAAFKASAKKLNVCVAHDEFIAFNSDGSDGAIRAALRKLADSPRTQVVMVFSYLEQGERLLRAAESLNITGRTWVASDAWANGVTKLNVSRDTLVGLFTFSIKSARLRRFEEFLRSLSVREAAGNYWWAQFLEEELGCTFGNASARARPCAAHETLPAGYPFGSDVVANVMDAVYAAAYAFQNALRACQLQNKTCTARAVPAKLLLDSAARVSFAGADGTRVAFDEAGDVTSIKYVIRNVQLGPGGQLTYVDVGAWSRTAGQKNFSVADAQIVWTSGVKPRSMCFRECGLGEHVVGQSGCCWNCQKCEKGSVSSAPGSVRCTVCNDTQYANDAQSLCVPRTVRSMHPSHPVALSMATLSCIGTLCTAVIAVIFVRMRDVSVLPSCSVSLTSVFFFTLFLSFAFAAAQISVPSRGVCAVLDSLLHVLLILYAGFLLASTQATMRVLKSAVSRYVDMLSAYLHGGLVAALTLLEVVFVGAWQATSPSVARLTNEGETSRLLECSGGFPALRVVATVFPLLVLLVATVVAFRGRNSHDNFNEAKFVSFSTIALCILLVAFFPTYWYVVGITRILIAAFTVFVAAFSCMGCIFIPKLYHIFVSSKRMTATEADAHTNNNPDDHPNGHLGNGHPSNYSSQHPTHATRDDVTTAACLRVPGQSVRFDLDPVRGQSNPTVISGNSNAAFVKEEPNAHAQDVVSL